CCLVTAGFSDTRGCQLGTATTFFLENRNFVREKKTRTEIPGTVLPSDCWVACCPRVPVMDNDHIVSRKP
ncbi:hypothetical protein AVEN_16316-1, partial [Araneus ventricosus]